MKRILFLIVSLGLIGVTRAYEDEFLTIVGDESVRTNWVGNRVVYVFTNTASAVSATFRQKMTLEEALVVGGGGAGGGFHGAGGGGGGILDLTARTFCPESAQISLTVGKGGAGNGNGVGRPGSSSSVTIGGVTSTARGGGGGGCGTSSLPSTGSNGSGGGAGCPGGSGAASVLASSDEYTSGQGNPGGNNPGSAKAGGGGGYSERGHDGRSFSVAEDKGVTGICGDGGEGLTNAITGVDVVYGSGGGGGGGTSNFGVTWAGKGGTNAGDGGAGRLSQNPDAASNLATVDGHAAPAGFGGGGGGGGACKEGFSSAQRRNGGAGGSGTVILSFSVGGEPGKPVIAQENVNFTFPDNESQPYFNITLTGAEGAAYSATVKVYCGTGALAQAGEAYQSTNSFEGVANGGSVEGFAFVYPQPDETFFVKIVASAESVEDTVFTTSVTVPSDCRVPFHVGKGGGAGVIHVRSGARGRGTGANWSDAYTDFRAALKEISAERPELWLAGDEGMNSAMTVTVAPPVAAAIRGGFAGSESAPGERARGMKSRIDGETAYNCLTVNNAQELTVDGFLFTRGANSGLVKTGEGDITVTNCTFDLNGFNGNRIDGRAMNLQGTAATTKATVVDCRIANHWELCIAGNCGTGALYLQNLVAAVVAECVFVSNGMQHTYGGYKASTGDPGRFGAGGAAISTCVPTDIRRSQFRANFGPSSTFDSNPVSAGIVRFNAGSGGSEMHNCVFAGNENVNSRDGRIDLYGGTVAVMMSAQTDTLLIDGCTFAYNVYDGHGSTAGINVKTGTVTLRNSIFHGNLATNSKKTLNAGTVPADILVHDGATLRATYTMFDPEKAGVSDQRADADGTLEIGTGCVYLDPLLVTAIDDISAYCGTSVKIFQPQYMDELCGIDCHLLSTVGYRTNGDDLWHEDGTVNSPAIDKGDPDDSVGDEEEPNGGFVNMGAYGGTAEASKTSMVTPEFDGPVAISFLGETSQPKISFKLGGSTPYTADADVFISTDGTTWTKVGDTLFGRANDGTTYEVVVKTCYEKGATLYAKVELATSSAKVSGQTDEGVVVTYDKHPSWGKGGGAGVIHVRAGATGDGSGSDWFNAIVDLGAAIRQIDEDRREVWCAGEWPTGATVSDPINPQVPAAIRGGFGGTELAAGERVSGARTVLDGNDESDCMIVQNATNLTIDGFCFTRGKARGLVKSGVGDITVTNCTFDANGAVSQNVSGRAMNLQGTAGVTHAVIADCRVVNHIEKGSDASKNGGAIYLGKLADATVSHCQFASNGVAYGTAPYRGDAAGRHSYWGGALAVQDVPVTVERCDFRGNQMPTSNISEGHAGGIVVLRGACGGSVLRNCVWAGNQNQHEQVATTYMSKKSGALVVDLADPAATARVENCTFVRNLFEGLDGTAGLNVCAGTVLVKDSIFHGNVCCANNTSNTVDILVRAGATANVTYTMVDSRADSRCDEGGMLDLGVGILEDDPRFVTSFADLGAHITSNGTQRIFKPVNQGKLVAFDCHVRPKSPAVDAGDPKSPYRNEPRPCGWRVNLGAYGNTPEAMTSPLGLLLMVR